MSPIFLSDDGKDYIMKYPWYGNVRELKNITEQIAVIEESRTITRAILQNYLNYVPEETLPAMYQGQQANLISDRELLLKALTMGQMINEMRSEINDLRNVVSQLAASIPSVGQQPLTQSHNSAITQFQPIDLSTPVGSHPLTQSHTNTITQFQPIPPEEEFQPSVIIDDDPISLEECEKKAIAQALQRHSGNRRLAAEELGISQRTLYRKLNSYGML